MTLIYQRNHVLNIASHGILLRGERAAARAPAMILVLEHRSGITPGEWGFLHIQLNKLRYSGIASLGTTIRTC